MSTLTRKTLAATWFGGATGLALSVGTPAQALVVETVAFNNSYSVSVPGNAPVASDDGGSMETIYRSSTLPSLRSEGGVNYTATADNSKFFFLHDNYCVGTCSTFSKTTIVFSLTNLGNEEVDLRFDSQITPGHLSRVLSSEGMNASFTFNVSQVTGGRSTSLYAASGTAGSEGVELDTGGLTFQGLNRTVDRAGRFEVLDWSTTNLNIKLDTIAAGETSQIIYEAFYQANSNASCGNLFVCPGVQVVFGDPRNNGGVGLFGSVAAALDDALEEPTPRAAINGLYGPSEVPFSFVSAGTPLPGAPEVIPPINYGSLFQSRLTAVPEPATWVMMIAGFGLIGSSLRRSGASAMVSAPRRS